VCFNLYSGKLPCFYLTSMLFFFESSKVILPYRPRVPLRQGGPMNPVGGSFLTSFSCFSGIFHRATTKGGLITSLLLPPFTVGQFVSGGIFFCGAPGPVWAPSTVKNVGSNKPSLSSVKRPHFLACVDRILFTWV